MGDRMVEGLITGNRASWALVAVIWLVSTALVAFRRADLGAIRLVSLLGVTTATSMAAFPLATALAVPRIRWKTVDAPDLVTPSGETWRRLRGPAVSVTDHDLPDIAVPTIDAEGRWVLFGLLSGRALAGLPPAPVAPREPGGPRLCRADGDECRAWPASWPDPGRPLGHGDLELMWDRSGDGRALAYDADAGLFLKARSGGDAALELVGRVTGDPSRDEASALFVVRRVAAGHLSAARIVSVPLGPLRGAEADAPADSARGVAALGGAGFAFRLQRAEVSLGAGPRVLRFVARPGLLVTLLALPVGLLWIGLRRRREVGETAKAAALATFAAGVAAAIPAVVALVSLWGSR